MITTFFLHLGMFKPALIGKRLNITDKLKENLSFVKLAFSLGEISKIKKNFPVNFFGNGNYFFENHFN